MVNQVIEMGEIYDISELNNLFVISSLSHRSFTILAKTCKSNFFIEIERDINENRKINFKIYNSLNQLVFENSITFEENLHNEFSLHSASISLGKTCELGYLNFNLFGYYLVISFDDSVFSENNQITFVIDGIGEEFSFKV